jgi:hypothetical protein
VRTFSEDGSRLFFQSYDALVPHDSNGRQDVFEYQGGHIYPLSNVAGDAESLFLDATPNGNDVFIATADQLLPQDHDFRMDIYDARVDSGFPVSTSPPPCNNGDACKPPPTPPPAVFGAPASATFSGAGNVPPFVAEKPAVKVKVKPKSCKKGFMKKHGRCVKKKAKKASSHSKKGRK